MYENKAIQPHEPFIKEKPPDNDRKHPMKIYVCSPYRPTCKKIECRRDELAANIERAKKACRILAGMGFMPLAPHLYFTEFLNDSEENERDKGMKLGLEWLEEADELWVFGKHISDGMKAEIARAKELGKTVRRLPEPGNVVEAILRGLAKTDDATMEDGTDNFDSTDNIDSTNNIDSTKCAESEENHGKSKNVPKSRDFSGE